MGFDVPEPGSEATCVDMEKELRASQEPPRTYLSQVGWEDLVPWVGGNGGAYPLIAALLSYLSSDPRDPPAVGPRGHLNL